MDRKDPEPVDYAPVETPRRRWDVFHVATIAPWVMILGGMLVGSLVALLVKILRG